MKARIATATKSIDWPRAARFALAIVGVLIVTNLGLPQAITGPLVNALLLLTVELVGVGAAAMVGMVSPLNALTHGALPVALAVMVPMIAVSNGILALTYGALLNRAPRWVALVAAAVLKVAFLSIAVTLLVAHPLTVSLGGEIQALAMPAAIVNMMRWPQLATALAGGLIASGALYGRKAWQRRNNNS